ncbi:hypothetical protein R5R35_012739 [Gryllus longicercus]|uniref:Major facilitator superfamily (MFS) profile domain-containing protein n=1 Tax=Gryllus longicercus TaxID=2509291 RepID=A0AAN9VTW6_9ORTH|nr:Facilitated trehalose transporter Tret1-2 homolog [Gryllus bimaculatus]
MNEMPTKTAEVELFLTNIHDDIKVQTVNSRSRQHLAAILANFAAICTGVVMGWTAPALPVLQRESNCSLPLCLSDGQASWMTAFMPLGALLGAIPVGYLADLLGRKRVLLSVAVPFIFGWMLIIFAGDSVWTVYAGRFFTGLGVGASTVLVPLYCEEIAEDAIRGALGAYLGFMICIGLLCIYTLGALLPYFWYTIIACLLPFVFVISFMWMPESPVFLASIGKMEAAKKSLLWLRNSSREDDIQPEFDGMLAFIKDRSDEKVRKSFLIFCSKRPFRSTTARAVAIILGLMFFQQMSGITAVESYTVQIFNDAGSSLPGNMSTVVMGAVQVVATLCSSFTVDHLGRRFLLLLSSVVMALCLACFSIYSYFNNNGFDVDSWRWVPLVVLNVFVIVYALGFGPLPWFMMAELLPMKAKGWASAMTVSFNWKIALGLTKEFPLMLKYAGQDITYATLSVFCICGTIFVALFVPETKGKTKTEIQAALGGDKP